MADFKGRFDMDFLQRYICLITFKRRQGMTDSWTLIHSVDSRVIQGEGNKDSSMGNSLGSGSLESSLFLLFLFNHRNLIF